MNNCNNMECNGWDHCIQEETSKPWAVKTKRNEAPILSPATKDEQKPSFEHGVGKNPEHFFGNKDFLGHKRLRPLTRTVLYTPTINQKV